MGSSPAGLAMDFGQSWPLFSAWSEAFRWSTTNSIELVISGVMLLLTNLSSGMPQPLHRTNRCRHVRRVRTLYKANARITRMHLIEQHNPYKPRPTQRTGSLQLNANAGVGIKDRK